MIRHRSSLPSPVLEQLEARLLLSGDTQLWPSGVDYSMYGFPTQPLDATAGAAQAAVVSGETAAEQGYACPPLPVQTPTGADPDPGATFVRNYDDITDYDWWYGCSPTTGGMHAAWWDIEVKLLTRDFGVSVYPGDFTNWQYGLYPSYTSGVFAVPDYANGVVSGWGHTYTAGWNGASQTWGNYTWMQHWPDSLSDFMGTAQDLNTGLEGVSLPDNVDWGMKNFMAWDDPRTVANESWNVLTQQVWGGGPNGELDFAAYQILIDGGLPVHLFIQNENGISHSGLGVGYFIDTNGNYFAELYTTWNEGVRQWTWVDQPIADASGATTNHTVVGAMSMGLANMPLAGLSGYFAIAHPNVSVLTVDIGLGDPAAPVWETNAWTADAQYAGMQNLVLTDVDLSAALPYLSQTEDWYLKVTDSGADPNVLTQITEIMDFQVRYGGFRWFTPNMGEATVVSDTAYAYVTSEAISEIHGTKWDDLNGDGVMDPGEPPLSGWTIYLDQDENGQLDVGTEQFTTTDAQGHYSFTDLPVDSYVVAEELQPGWAPTMPRAGSYRTGFLLGRIIQDVDFGNVQLAEIHGAKWNDIDRDAVRGAGESGLEGLTIYLDQNQNGALDQGELSTLTDANGEYAFTELMPGAYTVADVLEYGWTRSAPAGAAHQIILQSGDSLTDVDFGTYLGELPDLADNGDAGSSFSPTVVSAGDSWGSDWQIANLGTADAGQFRVDFYASLDDSLDAAEDILLGSVTLPGVATGQSALASLAIPSFPDLPAGNYHVGVIIDAGNEVVESDELNNMGVDADHYPLAVPGIRGTVWADLNDDGIKDPDEPRLSNWLIYLDQNQNGAFDLGEASTITDANGDYWFTDLQPGTYVVAQVLPMGWQQGVPAGASYQLAMTGGQVVDDADFGNYPTDMPDLFDDGDAYSRFDPTAVVAPGASWDVWWDIRNGGTAPAGPFRVDFYASEDDVITDSDHYLGFLMVPGLDAGDYIDLNLSLFSFPAVPAGDYYVGMIVDHDNDVIESDETNNVGVDHDYYPLTVSNLPELSDAGDAESGFAPRTVHPGESWEAWWGVANTGLIDAGQFRVNFYASTNQTISGSDRLLGSVLVPGLAAGETVDVNMLLLSFPSISPGDYYVGVIIDADNEVAELDELNNQSSDLDHYPLTVPLELPAIRGTVWHDRNGDEVRQAEEPGLSGWVVYLDQNDNGQPDRGERMVKTDPDGQYWFTGLEPGSYTVREVLWTGWGYTAPADGGQVITVADDELVEDVDFGNAQPSKLAGVVWHDQNGDGAITGGTPVENVLPGMTIRLYRDANHNGRLDAGEMGSLVTTSTDTDGAFVFEGVMPGPYVVDWDLGPLSAVFTIPPNGRYAVDVTSAQLIGGFDFGGAAPVELHGAKWEDLDGDGIKDPDEPGLSGWTIYLDADDSGQLDAGEIWTVTDGEDGHYAFTDLPPGSYIIREVQEPGWMQSSPSVGGVSANAPWNWLIFSGQLIGNLDFGNFKLGEIHGTKFHDLDADGVMKTPEEPGLAGWTISLFLDLNDNGQLDGNEALVTTSTDVDGNFSFVDLVPGIYIVSENLQPGWVQSVPAGGTIRITIASGDVVQGVYFGNYQNGEIYGSKWHDINADGVRNGGEPGLADWTIFLDQNQNGIFDDGETSTTTDVNGDYSFTGLIPAPYTVAEAVQVGWVQSAPASVDYDIMLQSGDLVFGIDFANYEPVQLHGGKWDDLNGDGVWDNDEPALEGWTIFLDEDLDGQLDAGELSTLTGADGSYSFTGLIPGDYVVAEVIPGGWAQSLPAGGTYSVSTVSGDVVQNLDFGNYQYGEIHGTKFHDLDANQMMDPGEPGLEGWTVFLDSNGNGVYDPFGSVTFDSTDVPLDIPDTGVAVTSEITVSGLAGPVLDVNVTLDITHQYDVDLVIYLISPSGARVRLVENAWGQDYTGTTFDDEAAIPIQFGTPPYTGSFQPEQPLSLADGTDPNGTWLLEIADVFTPDRGRLNSWSISIGLANLGEPSAVTDENGDYVLTDVPPGSYEVAEVPQDGWVQITPASGTHTVDVQSGDIIEGINFGNVEGAEIQGYKWHDVNGNGVRDGAEQGLQGWTISVYLDENDNGQLDANETLLTTTTGSTGSYSFVDLLPGNHIVSELSQSGWVQTAPVDGSYEITLTPGEVVDDLNFGNAEAADIHGMKWHDLNNDGNRDTGEPGLEGWVIFLDENGNGVRDPKEVFDTTDLTGQYSFVGLTPGTYTVAEVLPAGWVQSAPAAGFHQVTLRSGQSVSGKDFGNVQYGQIQGTKWHDVNGNAVMDIGEPGLDGWVIYLDQDRNGQRDPGELFGVTDADGAYTIDGLLPGMYIVAEEMHATWVQSAPAGGTYQVSLTGGQIVEDIDFANFQYAEISGRVWHDLDRDGMEGLGEPGMAGWTVVVFLDANGNGVLDGGESQQFAASDAQGDYVFDDLRPGNYVVSLQLQPGGALTGPAGGIHQVALLSGQVVQDNDFGIERLPIVGDVELSTTEDTPISDAVTGFDPEGDALTFAVLDPAAHGQVVMSPDGLFTYTPDEDWNGEDYFTFQAHDGFGPSSPGTVSLTVAPVNDGPELDGPADPVTTDEDTPVIIALTADDVETAQDDLVFTVTTSPGHGTLTKVSTGVYEYVPDPDYNGTDEVRFIVTDTGDPVSGDQGWGYDQPKDSAEVVASIVVQPLNDAPTAAAANVTTDENEPITIPLVGYDVETPAGQLVFTITTPPLHGSVTLTGNVALYTPGSDYYGLDGFEFTVTDNGDPAGSHDNPGDLGSAPAEVGIVVTRTVYFDAKNKAELHLFPGYPLIVKVSMTGPGQGSLSLSSFGGSDPRDISEIVLTGTTGKSSVKVTTKGKGSEVNVGDVIVNGALRNFKAATTNLLGDMTIDAGMRNLALGDVADDHTISIGAPATEKDTVKMTFGQVAELSINSATPIKSLRATEWLDDDAVPDTIFAPWLGSLKTKGHKRSGVAGHFEADLILDGSGAKKATLSSAKIAGDLRESTWDITGDMGNLNVSGTAVDSTIRTTGNMGNINLGAADHADFLAGVEGGVDRRASEPWHFDTLAYIKSFKIKGWKVAKGEQAPRFFVDSNLSAATVGGVSLSNAKFDNDGNPFGVFVRNLGSGDEIKYVKYTDTVSGERWTWRPGDPDVYTTPDLTIQLL